MFTATYRAATTGSGPILRTAALRDLVGGLAHEPRAYDEHETVFRRLKG